MSRRDASTSGTIGLQVYYRHENIPLWCPISSHFPPFLIPQFIFTRYMLYYPSVFSSVFKSSYPQNLLAQFPSYFYVYILRSQIVRFFVISF